MLFRWNVHLEKSMTFYLNRFKPHLLKNDLCQDWLNWPSSSVTCKEILKFRQCIFGFFFLLSYLGPWHGPSFEQVWFPSLKVALCKFCLKWYLSFFWRFSNLVNIFSLSLIIFLWKMVFFLMKLNTLLPRMPVFFNWPSGLGEEYS